MQKFKAVYFRLYVAFVVVASAYSLIEVMNTHQRGWLGVVLTSWPIAAFFIRLFTDPTPRTESKLIPIHILAVFGILVTASSTPTLEQLAFGITGFVGLLIYDLWSTPSVAKVNE